MQANNHAAEALFKWVSVTLRHTLHQSGILHDNEKKDNFLPLTWDVHNGTEDLILKGPGHSIQQTLTPLT